MQYQDLMSLLKSQIQALKIFQNENVTLLYQILQNEDQHQQCSNELKSNILQMMELLKKMNHRQQNQDLNTEKLRAQIQDQFEKIATPIEKMQQQLYKVMWSLGTLGVLNILIQIKQVECCQIKTRPAVEKAPKAYAKQGLFPVKGTGLPYRMASQKATFSCPWPCSRRRRRARWRK